MNISIRGVDVALFREFKAEAVREGLSIGAVVNQLLVQWVSERKQQKKKHSVLDFKPVDLGPGTERLSSEVDSTLYG